MKRPLFPFLLALPLGACVVPQPRPAPPVVQVSTAAVAAVAPAEPELRVLAPEEWPRIADDLDADSLERAANNSVKYLRAQGSALIKIGDRSVAPQLLIDTLQELVQLKRLSNDDKELNERLKASFDLLQVSLGTAPAETHYSSYYQPTTPARFKKDAEYKYPLYRKPPDMMLIPLGTFHDRWKGETLVARLDKNGSVVPYYSRRDIDVRNELAGKGLEIAWLNNQFDRLDLHIQGSGILVFPGGKEMLAKYAATNDRPYQSVGLAVAGSGAVSREALNHATLRKYLTDHPEGESWLLSRNPRYTFFDLVPLPPDGEPFGTIEQSLTPGRSIAVDPKFTPLGTVAVVNFPLPQADASGKLLGKHPTMRFALCQDTGGAIKGLGRVDFYVGHGPQAKTIAQNVWDKGRFYILLKKFPPRER